MQAKRVEFGTLQGEGKQYDHDLLTEAGAVRKRDKDPSRPRKGEFGHTPLTPKEDVPWGADEIIAGAGVRGALPVTEAFLEEARRRGVQVRGMLTEEVCGVSASGTPRRFTRSSTVPVDAPR